MKITELKYQKRDPNRVSVFIDDEYSFSLSAVNVVKHKLYPKFEINQEMIDTLFLEDLHLRLYNRCVDYIVRSPRSISQIKKYIQDTLFKKEGDWYSEGFSLDPDEIIESTVAKMIDADLLDDKNYAELYAHSRLIKKPLSKFELTGELMKKGISREIIDEVVEEMIPDDNSAARMALEKRFRVSSINKDSKDGVKRISFLQRKGYSWDVISRLFEDDV